MTVTKKCCQCDADGIVRVENDKWLCDEHITEQMHRPDIVAANEAERELDDFFDSGGKLS